jgi:Protein of unknown function (DUF2786)
MTDLQNGIAEKIRKLLALATSPNEHEAMAATAKAQALLAEHNLSMSDVKMATDKGDGFVLEKEMGSDSTPWRRRIAAAVAEMYFCKYFFQYEKKWTSQRKTGYIRYDWHTFVGVPHNVSVTKIMFSYLSGTVERLATEGSKSVPMRERSRYATAFKAACTLRLTHRIHERIEAAKRGEIKSESTGRNLPALLNTYLAVQSKLTTYINENVGELRTKKARITMSHAQGAADGSRAGDSIGLDQQVGGNNARLLK